MQASGRTANARDTRYKRLFLVVALTILSACSTAVSPEDFVPPKGKQVSGRRVLLLFAEAEPEIGPAPLTVQFSVWDPHDTAEDPKFFWDFGDGSPISNERKPVHVYEKPGDYTVKFYASDTDELVDDDELEIEVEEP